MTRKRILLVQLYSNGDCLYATVIARQIKEVDYPGCHLTWCVNKGSSQSVLMNPHVDEIMEVPVKTLMKEHEWQEFKASMALKENEYDHVFYTQVIAENTLKFDGGIRSSLYNNYPHTITVSHQPVLRLKQEETEVVRQFTGLHKLSSFKHVLLIECGPKSFTTSIDVTASLGLARKLVASFNDMAIILSSATAIETNDPRIIDGSVLNFRANAELTKYCTLFLGCSSGISWIATTDWAKQLPMIILTDNNLSYAASMVYDHKHCGLPIDHIIELQEGPAAIDKVYACIETVLTSSFAEARKNFHHDFKRKNYRFVYTIARSSFERGNIVGPLSMPSRIWKRNGFNFKVILYLIKAYLKLPVFLIKNISRSGKP